MTAAVGVGDPASVVEAVKVAGYGSTANLPTSGSFVFTEEVLPGDVIVVHFRDSQDTVHTVSGAGASWSKVGKLTGSFGRGQEWVIGRGATSGDVSWSISSAQPGRVTGFLLRGVNDSTVVDVVSGGLEARPSLVGPGQVFLASMANGLSTAPVFPAENTGRTKPVPGEWSVFPVESCGGSFFAGMVWNAPAETQSHVPTATGGSSVGNISYLRLGKATGTQGNYDTYPAVGTRPPAAAAGDLLLAHVTVYNSPGGVTAPADWDHVASVELPGLGGERKWTHLYSREATDSDPASWGWTGNAAIPGTHGSVSANIITLRGFTIDGVTTGTGTAPAARTVTTEVTPDKSSENGLVLAFYTDGWPLSVDHFRSSPDARVLWGAGWPASTDDNQNAVGAYRHTPIVAGQSVAGPSITTTGTYSTPIEYGWIALVGHVDTYVPPTPVIPPPEAWVPEVRVDGIPAAVEFVRVTSDSPARLSIPVRPGSIAGAEASLTWHHREVLSTQAEHPWEPDWRPTPGATVTIDVPGVDGVPFRAFTGVIDTTTLSLGGGPLVTRCVDPLADTDTRFSAPALTRTHPLKTVHTEDDRPRINLMTIWYAERALEAVGARSTVPRSSGTVWHQSMTGSLFPAVGELTAAGRWEDGAAVVPSPSPSFATFGDGTGRVGSTNPYVRGDARPWGGSTTDRVSLSLELDASTVESTTASGLVRVNSTTSSEGFGIRVEGSSVELVTMVPDGTITTRATLDRTGATRAVAQYDPATSTLSIATDLDPDSPTVVSGVTLSELHSAYARVRVIGQGGATGSTNYDEWPVAVGAVSVWRAGDALSGHPYLTWPRSAAFHLTPTWGERWWLQAHPPVIEEKSVGWITRNSQRELALVWTDHLGVTHWADSGAFDSLTPSGTITDARIIDRTTEVPFVDLRHTVERRDRFSHVEVTGKRAAVRWGSDEYPRRVAARARESIELVSGGAAETLWLEPEPGTFWIGDLHLPPRWAGTATLSDYKRTEGSWVGGHVVDSTGAVLRWATSSDVTFDIDVVDDASVKVTMTAGPGLVAGETFVNTPHPDVALPAEVSARPLPVLTAWSVATVTDVVGESTSVGASARPAYVHDAGWSGGWSSGVRSPEQLAQVIADRYVSDVGEVLIECPPAPVRIGQRWTVEVDAVAGLVIDGVVLGSTIEASAGESSMVLRLWVLEVT